MSENKKLKKKEKKLRKEQSKWVNEMSECIKKDKNVSNVTSRLSDSHGHVMISLNKKHGIREGYHLPTGSGLPSELKWSMTIGDIKKLEKISERIKKLKE